MENDDRVIERRAVIGADKFDAAWQEADLYSGLVPDVVLPPTSARAGWKERNNRCLT